MSNSIKKRISIPADTEGFVLSECSICGELFKLDASIIQDEAQLLLWCPNCGLNRQSFVSSEVINYTEKVVENHMAKVLNEFSKDLKKTFKKNSFKVKTRNKISEVIPDPIISKVENLERKIYQCCKNEAKISPNLKIEGSYCPYCGEMIDGSY